MEENIPKQAAEPMPVPEKTKKKSPVLTIIFAILALAGIGFGVYGMFFNNSESTKCAEISKEENPEEEPEDVAQKDEDYTIYYDLVKKYFISNSYYNTPTYEAGDFNNVDYMASVLYDNNIITVNSNLYDASGTIYADTFKDGLKTFFNYEDEVEEFTINCVGTFKLIPQNGGFSAQYKTEHFGGCGGAAGSKPILTIVDIEAKNNLLQIEVAYSRINMTPGLPYEIFNEEFKEITDANQYFENNLDKALRYKLTFKKADKHYYLESGEKLN